MMNPIASSAAPAPRRQRSAGSRTRAVLLTMLTLIATVLCLVAIHGFGAGHSMTHSSALGTTAHHATIAAQPTLADATATATRSGPTMTLAASTNQPTMCTQQNSLGGNGTVGITCSDVLVVGSNALLAQEPTDAGLIVAPGGFVNDSFRAIPLHLHRPSLTLLSISRV